MIRVITYGTFDLLHFGHIRLLERAKELGDYLIVGVTADDFDKNRGKINVQQSLMERIEAIKAAGVADEIIVEEYEGQKIDDIKRYDINIFTVGSDWAGKFDYLNEYCQVVYLDRTQGVSSSELRAAKRESSFGLAGESIILEKFRQECSYVNGLCVSGICSRDRLCCESARKEGIPVYENYSELLDAVDAVYIIESPRKQHEFVEKALRCGKHVLCEAPIAMDVKHMKELYDLAEANGLILMEGIKTAYATAYNRLNLLIKSGKIGHVMSVEATCTSLRDIKNMNSRDFAEKWNSIFAWGPTALLPVFQILGSEYLDCRITSCFADEACMYDLFTKMDLIYSDAVASVKVGQGVKSEGELIISGTQGYIYVPAPWWKMDYFEIRYENPADNKRYFYQLEGEGIRYELAAFVKAIKSKKNTAYIEREVSGAIAGVMERFESGNVMRLRI